MRLTLGDAMWTPAGQFWIWFFGYSKEAEPMRCVFGLSRQFQELDSGGEPSKWQLRLVLFGKYFTLYKER